MTLTSNDLEHVPLPVASRASASTPPSAIDQPLDAVAATGERNVRRPSYTAAMNSAQRLDEQEQHREIHGDLQHALRAHSNFSG